MQSEVYPLPLRSLNELAGYGDVVVMSFPGDTDTPTAKRLVRVWRCLLLCCHGIKRNTDSFPVGGRCGGGKCGGTTGKPALIYIPPGTYLLSSTVQLLINTQIIGDGINFPTLKAPANATNGTIVISGYDDGQPALNNFFIGIRNVNIDTTAAPVDNTIFALNWAVSQATNLINVNFLLRPQSNHIGIEMDGGSAGGGSGMFMGDLTFQGGLVGILFNNQQYAIRNVK